MKRLMLCLAIVILMSAGVSFDVRGQDIGLYFDEVRSSWCVEEGTGMYEVWIWARPSENGLDCFELSLMSEQYPGGFVAFAPIYNPMLEEPILGAPFSEVLLGCFATCQSDWVWIARNTIFLQNTDPVYITVGPGNYSGNPEPYFTNCSGYDETANVLSYLIINSECVAPETEILRVSVESLTMVEAEFNVDVLEADAEDVSNYEIFLESDPLHTETILSAELAEDSNSVSLTLGSVATPNAPYILRASNISNIYGGTCTAAEIGFFFGPDMIISGIYATPDRIGDGCTSIEGEFTVKNIGVAETGSFDVALSFLINNGASDIDDFAVVPIDLYGVANLAAGDSIVQSFSTQLPPDAAYDRNYVLAVADAADEVAELSEVNNAGRFTLTTLFPSIRYVEDVYNDTGGMVEIRYISSSADKVGIENPVTGYEILRRMDPPPPSAVSSPPDAEKSEEENVLDADALNIDPVNGGCLAAAEWELVEWVDADGSLSYSVEVPTLADSTGENGVFWSVYVIRAVRPIDGSDLYYLSCPDSGYSIDNSQNPPDLVVTDLVVTPGEIRDGCVAVEIEYMIRNMGSGDAQGSIENELRFLVNDGTSNVDNYMLVLLIWEMFGELAAGDSIHVTYESFYHGMAYDQNFVEVVLDEDDYILESDEENNSLRFLMPTYIPRIESITDVLYDTGKQVWIEFLASSVDKKGITDPVTSYDILRNDGSEWNVVGSVTAATQIEYSVIAPTLYDDLPTVFEVRAVHPVGETTSYYTSCAEWGISINDGPPIATLLQGYDAVLRGGSVELSWSMASVDDAVAFSVSRSASGGEWAELPVDALEQEGLVFVYLDDNVEPEESYVYRVEYDTEGASVLLFQTEPVATPAIPLTLEQNVPNPFNPVTEIRYYLPEALDVRLEIYDISGRLVRLLVDGRQEKGWRIARWDGCDGGFHQVASGVYFYRLRAGKEVVSKKMILLR